MANIRIILNNIICVRGPLRNMLPKSNTINNTTPQWTSFCMMHSSHSNKNQDNNKGECSQADQKIDFKHDLQHFKARQAKQADFKCVDGTHSNEPPIGTHALPHPIWSDKDMLEVKVTHKPPVNFVEKLAFNCVKLMRKSFDLMSGYEKEPRTENMWINRICFLETVAGVPGMVAAMVRHLSSLRLMRRDHGWIHTLLEEAENERMHLMTALQLKQPGILFQAGVVVTQGIFVVGFSLAYLISPKFCHRFVGYLEEEAVTTYSKLIKDMEEGGPMSHWNHQKAPELAIRYWQLPPTASMTDVILSIRADEAHHRHVNHTMASMKPDDYNPYKPGE